MLSLHRHRHCRPGRTTVLQRWLLFAPVRSPEQASRAAGGLGTDSGYRGCRVHGLVVGSRWMRLSPTPLADSVRWSERPRGLGEGRGEGGVSRRPAWSLGASWLGRAEQATPGVAGPGCLWPGIFSVFSLEGLILSHFADEDSESQRNQVTCSQLCGQ